MSNLLIEAEKDARYNNLSIHDLKMMRKNMIEQGKHTKYEFACVQYHIMKKENRLDHLMGIL